MTFQRGNKLSLGLRRSEETRRKMSVAKIGNKFRTGLKHSEETKLKMSLSQKGRGLGEKHPEHSNWLKEHNHKPMLGKRHSEESKKKMSEANLGERSCKWKGGISKNRNKYLVNRRKKLVENGGHHTKAEWETLKAQYNWTCPCCKRLEPSIKLSKDHIIPVSKGGSENIENIQPLCMRCNVKKHTLEIRYEK